MIGVGAIIYKAKRIFQSIPRPQQKLWSLDIVLAFLVTLTITFFGLTIYNVLQGNIDLLPYKLARFLSFKILDTSSAATLFVTLLGALLVRHQFALSLLPRINYKSSAATRNDIVNPETSIETWRVEILNSGLGAAIINRLHFTMQLPDAAKSSFSGGHRDITDELAKLGLVRYRDYWLENITTGFALSAKEGLPVFEIKKEHLPKLKRLDMVLYFQNQLGGKYWREIFLIPHKNIR